MATAFQCARGFLPCRSRAGGKTAGATADLGPWSEHCCSVGWSGRAVKTYRRDQSWKPGCQSRSLGAASSAGSVQAASSCQTSLGGCQALAWHTRQPCLGLSTGHREVTEAAAFFLSVLLLPKPCTALQASGDRRPQENKADQRGLQQCSDCRFGGQRPSLAAAVLVQALAHLCPTSCGLGEGPDQVQHFSPVP